MKTVKSIEEKIENLAKTQLGKTKYFTKTEFINKEIEIRSSLHLLKAVVMDQTTPILNF